MQEDKNNDINANNSQQPAGPVAQAQPVEPQPEKKQKGKKPLIILLVVLVLVLAGVGAWFVFGKTEDEQAIQQTTQTTAEETPETATLKTTTFTSGLLDKSTVTFEHPSGWTITESEEPMLGADPPFLLKTMTVDDGKGHVLIINDRDGFGGGCDEDDVAYKLTHKTATKTPNLYFTQYETTGDFYYKDLILVEVFGDGYTSAQHETLKVGESATNTCNLPLWSVVAGGVFVHIAKSADDSAQWLGFEDIADSPEFMSMLESFVVVDNYVRPEI